MRDLLATLQNPYNRRLAFEVAVLGDADVGFFVLFFRFFELDLVDFDAVFGVLEVWVDGEGVCFVDVFAFGVFG